MASDCAAELRMIRENLKASVDKDVAELLQLLAQAGEKARAVQAATLAGSPPQPPTEVTAPALEADVGQPAPEKDGGQPAPENEAWMDSRPVPECVRLSAATGVRLSAATGVRSTWLQKKKSDKNIRELAVQRCGQWGAHVEPITGIVIVLNALVIGLSVNDTSSVWVGFEVFFCLFFCFELFFRLYLLGWRRHFFGRDWAWSWFDFVIVVVALVSLVGFVLDTIYPEEEYSNDSVGVFTIFRLGRLLRISRILTVLKLKQFRELAMLVSGVTGGFRTLLWAFVLVGVVCYISAIVVVQTMDWLEQDCVLGGSIASAALGFGRREDGRGCSTVLDEERQQLFSTVPRAMFTVFRCFTDGCTTAGGQSLVSHVLELRGGGAYTFCYVSAYIFVQFGIFNLVAAVFVETTLNYCKEADQARYRKLVRDEQALRQAVCKALASGEAVDEVSEHEGSLKRLRKKVKAGLGFSSVAVAAEESKDFSADLSPVITREEFEDTLGNPRVAGMLEDLQITVHHPDRLFTLMDVNRDGRLTADEIIDGLLMLRGDMDKGDVVSNSMRLRSMQKSIATIQATLNNAQRTLT